MLSKIGFSDRSIRGTLRGGMAGLAIVLVGFGVPELGWAAAPDPTMSTFRHRRLTTESGLPQNFIKAIAQTPDGALWIGTGTGLARFDGTEFEIFDRSSSGLPSLDILQLQVDSDGTLWILTAAGLASLPVERAVGAAFERSAGFVRHPVPEGLDPRFAWLLAAPSGELWLKERRQIWRRAEKAVAAPWLELFAARDSTYAPFRSQSDGLAVFPWSEGALHGLILDGADSPVRLEIGSGLGASSQVPFDGPVWLGRHHLWVAHGKVLSRYWLDRRAWELEPAGALTLPEAPHVLQRSRSGELWVGTRRGLYRAAEDLNPDAGFRLELVEPAIRQLFEDREGSLWVGTDGQGLIQVYGPTKFSVLSTDEGLPHDTVWALAQDGRDDLWVGTQRGLVRVRSGRVEGVHPEVFGNQEIYSIAPGRDRQMWVSCERGVFEVPLEPSQRPRQVIEADGIRSRILVTPSEIWFGGGPVLYRFDGDGAPAEVFRIPDPAARIRDFRLDARGDFWVATSGAGIWRQLEGRWLPLEGAGLPRSVSSFYEDSGGALWIATRERGVFRHLNGELVGLAPEHGLFDATIHHIVEDGLGFLWMSSDRGPFKVEKRELDRVANGLSPRFKSVPFSAEDGLKSVECNSLFPGLLKLRDGRLAFATMAGVAFTDPGRPPRIDVATGVEIVDFAVGYDHRSPRSPMVLEPGERDIAITFRAITLVAPHRADFKYRLEGYDDTWKAADGRPIAYYTDLPPGSFIFRVKAANVDGVWSERDAVLRVTVLAPWYRSAWVWLGLAGLVAIFGIGPASIRRRLRGRDPKPVEVEGAQRNSAAPDPPAPPGASSRLPEGAGASVTGSGTPRLTASEAEVPAADEVFLRRVGEAVEAKLSSQSFGVFELAEELAVSERHLRRKLLALTGESPSVLIRRFRMERAKQLLQASAGNVSEIAAAVGFSHPSHFSKIYRNTYGRPPSADRPEPSSD